MPVVMFITAVQASFHDGHTISDNTLKLALYLILQSDSHMFSLDWSIPCIK